MGNFLPPKILVDSSLPLPVTIAKELLAFFILWICWKWTSGGRGKERERSRSPLLPPERHFIRYALCAAVYRHRRFYLLIVSMFEGHFAGNGANRVVGLLRPKQPFCLGVILACRFRR